MPLGYRLLLLLRPLLDSRELLSLLLEDEDEFRDEEEEPCDEELLDADALDLERELDPELEPRGLLGCEEERLRDADELERVPDDPEFERLAPLRNEDWRDEEAAELEPFRLDLDDDAAIGRERSSLEELLRGREPDGDRVRELAPELVEAMLLMFARDREPDEVLLAVMRSRSKFLTGLWPRGLSGCDFDRETTFPDDEEELRGRDALLVTLRESFEETREPPAPPLRVREVGLLEDSRRFEEAEPERPS